MDCLPAPVSPERQALREHLRSLVHFAQCGGPPAPKSFDARIGAYHDRKQAFLATVERSRFSPDLAQARREEEEANRNVFAAECRIYPPEMAEEPENVSAHEQMWSTRERQLAEAERRFEALDRACPASRRT